MNLRQLEILRAVMRVRSTVGAARDLGMSQPAVSNAIKAAETSLGFLLFDRVGKRLVPTQEAHILLKEAEPLFLMQEVVSRTAANLRTGRQGRIRLVATSELSESLVPQTLARMIKRHAGLEVSLETQRVEALLEYVETGICDIGFAMRPPPRPTLEYVPIGQLDIVCACSVDSPLAGLAAATPAELQHMPLISVTGMASALIEDAFLKSSARFAPKFEVRFMNVAGYFAEAGLGVTFMDQLTVSTPHFARLTSVPFLPRTTITAYAIASPDRLRQRLSRELIRYAQEEIEARTGQGRAGRQ